VARRHDDLGESVRSRSNFQHSSIRQENHIMSEGSSFFSRSSSAFSSGDQQAKKQAVMEEVSAKFSSQFCPPK
jgi:hypothetical protein